MCACSVTSVMSDSLRPCGLPTRLFPWDSPGKNTGVGCHALLQGIFMTQWLNPHLLQLLHCREILYHKTHGKPSPPLGDPKSSTNYVAFSRTWEFHFPTSSLSLAIKQYFSKLVNLKGQKLDGLTLVCFSWLQWSFTPFIICLLDICFFVLFWFGLVHCTHILCPFFDWCFSLHWF